MISRLFSRRLCVTLLALGLSVAALAVADPAWAKSIGVDVWNMPSLNEELQESTVKSEQLDGTEQELLRRIEVKEVLVRDLIEGRATLAEVTEQFHELNSSRPTYMTAIRANFPGSTDEEKMARNVISFAIPRVPASQRKALATRLEAELQQMLAGIASE